MTANNNSNKSISNNVPDDLDVVDGALAGLKQQYDELVKTIKIKYDEQQKIFQQMASTDYQGKDYNEDRINHLINENVNNLKQQRDDIWKYLTTIYNKNTQQTYRNLKNIKNNQKYIEENKIKKEELKTKFGDLKNENNANKKLILHNMYHHKEIYNKTYVQFIMMLALVTCIIIMYLTANNIINSGVGYGSVIMIAIIAIFYTVYRIYIYRMNRDKFQWHKTQYERIDPVQENNSSNSSNSGTIDGIDYEVLDKQAKLEFSKEKESCPSE